MPTVIKEYMAEFPIMPKKSRGDKFNGIEIYVPFLSCAGTEIAANPWEATITNDLISAVTRVYPFSTIPGPYAFASYPNPTLPPTLLPNDTAQTMFIGPGAEEAFQIWNTVSASTQGSVSISNLTDYHTATTTQMYNTQILTRPEFTGWNQMLKSSILLASNVWLLDNSSFGFTQTLVPVFYSRDRPAASAYLNYYDESAMIISEAIELGAFMQRYFIPFAHQRSGDGFGPSLHFDHRVAQGLGGGYFSVIRSGLFGLIKGIASGVSGNPTTLSDKYSPQAQQIVHQTIVGLANDPKKFRPGAVLRFQQRLG